MGLARKAGAAVSAAFLVSAALGADAASGRVEEIVARSVQNTNADWAAAPRWDFTEHDVITKDGKKIVKASEVTMIDGSPYNKPIAWNGHPLSAAQAANEERKLQQETARRRDESPAARQKRIAEYQKQRRQDRELMQQMARGFRFKLLGEEMVDGRRCFALEATPRPGYEPPTRDTKVLTGMRGKMWIDAEQYQWVKVHAEVFRPVRFGLFIARVQAGTEFTLEQKAVAGNVWLPSHFETRVRAKVLVFSRRSIDDETYSDYRLAGEAARASSR